MQNQSLYKVATAQLHLCTVLCNVKPEKMCNFYTKFITASKFLVAQNYFLHTLRGVCSSHLWQVSNKSQMLLQLISEVHNMQPLIYMVRKTILFALQWALECFYKYIIKGVIKGKPHACTFFTPWGWFSNTLYFRNHLTEIKKIGKEIWLWGQYIYQISSQSEMVRCKFNFHVCWFSTECP
jgi:hypothetical protein